MCSTARETLKFPAFLIKDELCTGKFYLFASCSMSLSINQTLFRFNTNGRTPSHNNFDNITEDNDNNRQMNSQGLNKLARYTGMYIIAHIRRLPIIQNTNNDQNSVNDDDAIDDANNVGDDDMIIMLIIVTAVKFY